jgi:hypothetical protein
MDENGELQTRFYQLSLVDTSDLIGRTFLSEQDNGQKHRARIVAAKLKITMQALKRT